MGIAECVRHDQQSYFSASMRDCHERILSGLRTLLADANYQFGAGYFPCLLAGVVADDTVMALAFAATPLCSSMCPVRPPCFVVILDRLWRPVAPSPRLQNLRMKMACQNRVLLSITIHLCAGMQLFQVLTTRAFAALSRNWQLRTAHMAAVAHVPWLAHVGVRNLCRICQGRMRRQPFCSGRLWTIWRTTGCGT